MAKCQTLLAYHCIYRQSSEKSKTVVPNEKLFKFLDGECPSKVNKLNLKGFISLAFHA